MAKCSRHVLRASLILGIVSLFTFSFSTPALAAVAQPSDLSILNVQAYENSKEDGDQLYIISYLVDFAGEYSDSIDELFIFRLLDEDGAELASAEAYPYYNQGYGRGVVAFYLAPGECPAWGSAVSIELSGNPLVDWDGDTPSTTATAVTWTTDSHSEIGQVVSGKIIYHASQLEQVWEVEMTQVSGSSTILSETGAAYFLRVVPYLSEVAPYVLGQYVFPAEYPAEKPTEDTYASDLEELISGSIFDLSATAEDWGMSRGALTGMIYYPFVALILGLLLFKKRIKKGLLLLAWPFVIAGAFIGVPLTVTIIAAFLAFVSTILVTVYRHST